jgi:hypothetical protein
VRDKQGIPAGTFALTLGGYLLSWLRTGVWPHSVQVPGETLFSAAAHRLFGVALIWLAASLGAARGEAEKGLFCPM